MEREKPQSKISLFEEVGKLQQLNKKDMRTEGLVLHQKKEKEKRQFTTPDTAGHARLYEKAKEPRRQSGPKVLQ